MCDASFFSEHDNITKSENVPLARKKLSGVPAQQKTCFEHVPEYSRVNPDQIEYNNLNVLYENC